MGLLGGIRRSARRGERLAAALGLVRRGGAEEAAARIAAGGRPVVLLHGGGPGAGAPLEVLERRLLRAGYAAFALELGGVRDALARRGIDDLAELLRVEVERLCARHPRLPPLSIVGHARGGLVAAYYVKKLGGWRRTGGVVTLGTAHRGAPPGWLGLLPLGLLDRASAQSAPASPLLARLQDGAWPAQVRLASLWSREDRASPYPSCVIDTHGLPQLSNVEVGGDHRALVTRRRVYDAVVRELREAEAQAPVVRGPLTGLAGGRTREGLGAGGESGSSSGAA